MGRASTKTRTREQRQAEAEALQASVVEQVEALATSEGWQRFLKMTRGFHSYSLNNGVIVKPRRFVCETPRRGPPGT